MKLRMMLVLIAALALAGCRRGTVQIQPDGSGGANVTVTWTEAEVNSAIQEALVASGNPLLRNPSVDLQNGQILVTGEHMQRDNTGTVQGSFVLTLAAQNGAILPTISNVNIDGIAANDQTVTNLNDRLRDAFNRRANLTRRISVTSVTITDSNIQIVADVTR
jgi:hypothetical protein